MCHPQLVLGDGSDLLEADPMFGGRTVTMDVGFGIHRRWNQHRDLISDSHEDLQIDNKSDLLTRLGKTTDPGLWYNVNVDYSGGLP